MSLLSDNNIDFQRSIPNKSDFKISGGIHSSFLINNSILQQEFEKFVISLKAKNAHLLEKRYYYINIWSMACKPCLDEIPLIDSLLSSFTNQITYVMVSSHSNEAVSNFLKNKNIEMKNFVFLNEMIDFISGIYNEIEVKKQSFPLHVVLDKKGNCLAYLFGAIHDENSAAPLINFIKTLK